MEPVYERAQLLVERNQPNEVLASISPELSKDFNNPVALELLGHAYYQRGEWGLAANVYKQAHCLRPSADVLTNLGACFKQTDQLAEAEEVWSMALGMEKRPHKRSGLLANMAGCFTANGTPARALELYKRSLEADPSNRIAYYNMCWPYLEQRDWAHGWRAYDAGFTSGVRTMRTYDRVPPVNVDLSPAKMRDSLKGKRVIVWGDQGLGDEILAASCVPDLMRDAKEVVFDCHPRLREIFSRSFGIECTGTRKTQNIEWFRNRQFDISVPITTLMTIYRSEGQWPGTPYLVRKHDTEQGRGLRRGIGLSWAGGVQSTRAHVRSMPLETLAPVLAGADVDWYSLQYHESASAEVCGLDESHRVRVRHFPKTLLAQDYDQTMSLVAGLDLVITVCTTVMHLAGAMGVPCWVMTPHRAPWVMGTTGDDMPMYNSVRQFRQQPEEKDWSGVVSRIRLALQGEDYDPRMLTADEMSALDNIIVQAAQ